MSFALILAGLIIVLLTGVPAFAGLGLFSIAILYGVEGNLGNIGELVFGKLDTYLLVSIPLFTLMAHFMIRGKVVDDLFGAAHTMLRHLHGGLAIATVAACTVFAAISGSSVATALTVGSAAIPLMIRFGYDPKVAYGVVGGGGTLGILIPPSGPMILYGVVSDTSIGALFMAGVMPGPDDRADIRPVLLHPGPLRHGAGRDRTAGDAGRSRRRAAQIILGADPARPGAGRHVLWRLHRDRSRSGRRACRIC